MLLIPKYCPHCGSMKLDELSKDPVYMNQLTGVELTSEMAPNLEELEDSALETHYEVGCESCGWTGFIIPDERTTAELERSLVETPIQLPDSDSKHQN